MKDGTLPIFDCQLPIGIWASVHFISIKAHLIGFTQNRQSAIENRQCFILHPSNESLLRLRRSLQIFNINLLHLHHRLHDSLRLLFVRILD